MILNKIGNLTTSSYRACMSMCMYNIIIIECEVKTRCFPQNENISCEMEKVIEKTKTEKEMNKNHFPMCTDALISFQI